MLNNGNDTFVWVCAEQLCSNKKSESIQCKNKYGGGYGREILLTCKSNETVKVYFTCEQGRILLPNSVGTVTGKQYYSFEKNGAYEIKIIDNTTNKNVIPTKYFNDNKEKPKAFNVYNTKKSKEISFKGIKGRTYTIKAWFWRASTTATSYKLGGIGAERDNAYWSVMPKIFANVNASTATLNTIKYLTR